MEVHITYLKMESKAQLRGAKLTDSRLRCDRLSRCPASFYRYLYTQVGSKYFWLERRDWTDAQILNHLNLPNISLWVLYFTGSPAGYFELCEYPDNSIKIAYFGLLEEFIGQGLGKHLLTIAIEEAWRGVTESDGASGAARCDRSQDRFVWVHTCNLDRSSALPNYLSRGFQIFKQETKQWG
jgi:GNAT superfamily N-acetyltransferase